MFKNHSRSQERQAAEKAGRILDYIKEDLYMKNVTATSSVSLPYTESLDATRVLEVRDNEGILEARIVTSGKDTPWLVL